MTIKIKNYTRRYKRLFVHRNVRAYIRVGSDKSLVGSDVREGTDLPQVKNSFHKSKIIFPPGVLSVTASPVRGLNPHQNPNPKRPIKPGIYLTRRWYPKTLSARRAPSPLPVGLKWARLKWL